MVQPFWKNVWCLLNELNITLPYDPAIPLLGVCPKESKTDTQTKACTQMFIAALLTTAKGWKQPNCPTTEEWIKCDPSIQ